MQPPLLNEALSIACTPNILDLFAQTMDDLGVVGEERLAKLLYLAVTSRVFETPVSVAVKGPSSAGKSYSVGKVLSFFPSEAHHELTAMSEKALIYSEEPLEHRFLVVYEFAGMKGEFAEYVIRSLLSEGRVRYATTDKSTDGMKGRLIERNGPTGLIVTTTLAAMHHENETRYISVTVSDTREQTKHILRAMAMKVKRPEVNVEPWHEFHRWLAGGNTEVVIPFAETLVEVIDPVAVRLRRDFGKLLTLISAHALIHRRTRDLDAEGRIIATLDDYRGVHTIANDLIEAGVAATVPQAVRETVDAVADLIAEKAKTTPSFGFHDEPLSVRVTELATALGLDKSVASRRFMVARQAGYLDNLEWRKGRPARIVLAEPLPEEKVIFPTPDTLANALTGCTVARAAEGNGAAGDGGEVAEAA